jgi:gamma-glutamylcyclotransferase (GGCT)/AIG2-like uncharacterized protein YtfP
VSTPKPKRIFVYGSLRQGEYNYFKEMGEPICVGKITNADLYSLGVFPCIVATSADDRTVVGEVYDIPIKSFDDIERMELGAGYYRKAVKVAPTNRIVHDLVDADAYFYPEVKAWFADARITSGDWSLRGETK